MRFLIVPIPNVSIVTVNFNQYQYTAQCLDTILAHPPKTSFEIVLVDNASNDGSAERLASEYPQVKLVNSSVNRGIAGGNNLGIKNGNSRYVLLLNNDTLVLSGSIDRLVEFLDSHPEAGGSGGYLLNPDRSFQSGANDFHTVWDEFLNLTHLGLLLRPFWPSHPPSPFVQEVDWMSTAFMLFRREALEAVGLVDERFFIYADESDLEYRLRKSDWKIFCVPGAEIVHYGGKSLKPWVSRPLKYRGRLLYFIKHHTTLDVILVRLLFAISSILKIGFWSIAFLFPTSHERAGLELNSHFKILQLAILPFDFNRHLPSSVRF